MTYFIVPTNVSNHIVLPTPLAGPMLVPLALGFYLSVYRRHIDPSGALLSNKMFITHESLASQAIFQWS